MSGMDCGRNCVQDKQTFLGVTRHYLENSSHSAEEEVTHLEHLENSKHLK